QAGRNAGNALPLRAMATGAVGLENASAEFDLAGALLLHIIRQTLRLTDAQDDDDRRTEQNKDGAKYDLELNAFHGCLLSSYPVTQNPACASHAGNRCVRRSCPLRWTGRSNRPAGLSAPCPVGTARR